MELITHLIDIVAEESTSPTNDNDNLFIFNWYFSQLSITEMLANLNQQPTTMIFTI